MASYNLVRTAEAQPIGSVVPWTGPLTKIPKGWLICNGAELNASEYPLLARSIRDTYGGQSFAGTFPNYTGTFKLPSINQKALADISLDYFTNTTLSQPTIGVDNLTSKAVVQAYIGTETDLGPPATVNAITDMNFSYTPDPDGIITSFTFTGTAATTTTAVLYSNIPATTTTVGASGTGSFYNVVRNTDSTYTVTLKQKGSNYAVGNTLKISGTLIGGSTPTNDITITVTGIGNGFFSGTITGTNGGNLNFTPGFGVTSVYVVPRKLGRQHMPQHFHPGSYTTINKNDSTDNPGLGVGVFDNQTVDVFDYADCLYPAYPFIQGGGRYINTGSCLNNVEGVNVWGNSQSAGTITITAPFDTGVGRYALASIQGGKPAREYVAKFTAAGGHGVGKSWFTDALKLRDGNGNVSSGSNALATLRADGKIREGTYIPFSDDKTLNYYINYDDGTAGGLGSDLAQSYQKVMFNNAATSFTKTTRTNLTVNDVIVPHDHTGSFNITFDKGSMSLPSSITAQATANVTPDNVPNAFSINFTIATPSLAILNLIRAY